MESIQKQMGNAIRAGETRQNPAPDVQLFLSLIPEMQRRFIPENGGDARQLLDIIEWCVEREYWLQALALCRENLPECLFDLGLLRYEQSFGANFERYLESRKRTAPPAGSRDWCAEVVKALCGGQVFVGLEQTVGKGDWEAILSGWDELRLIRNAAIHNQEPGEADEEYWAYAKLEPEEIAGRIQAVLNRVRQAIG